MNYARLTDSELMHEAKQLVRREAQLLTQILRCIAEIDRRRLYSDYKMPGLLELVMTELGYPRDQAIRRIQAMRMIRAMPVVEIKLAAGELSLTSIGIVQSLFSGEKRVGKPLSLAQKHEVIEQVSGKSTREAQRLVLSLSSSPVSLRESVKLVTPDLYEARILLDEESIQMLETIRGRFAHTHPNASLGQLIKLLLSEQLGTRGTVNTKGCEGGEVNRSAGAKANRRESSKPDCSESAVAKCSAGADAKSSESANARPSESADSAQDAVAAPRPELMRQPPVAAPRPQSGGQARSGQKSAPKAEAGSDLHSKTEAGSGLQSRAEVRRQIWWRDEGRCSICGSTYAVQEDHRVPKAKGGEYSTTNMRLLCRSCNQRAAIKHYGQAKMDSYIN
jgi:hypothetical protein